MDRGKLDGIEGMFPVLSLEYEDRSVWVERFDMMWESLVV